MIIEAVFFIFIIVLLMVAYANLARREQRTRKDLFQLMDINRESIIIPTHRGEINLRGEPIVGIFNAINDIDRKLSAKYKR